MMKRGLLVFNIFLLLLLVAGAGCGSTAQGFGKKATILRLHVEARPDPSSASEISVYRVSPIKVWIEKSPILDEGHVAGAELVEERGAHQIRLQFIPQGKHLLETYTTMNRGRRIAIFCAFGELRWLGAPQVPRTTDGTLIFTPDATRAECERIVKGLNDVAREMKRQDILK